MSSSSITKQVWVPCCLASGGYIQPHKPQGENNGDIYSKAHKEEQKPTRMSHVTNHAIIDATSRWMVHSQRKSPATSPVASIPYKKASGFLNRKIWPTYNISPTWISMKFWKIPCLSYLFGVRSCEVVIIWPEIVHQPENSSSWEEFPTIRSGWGGGTPAWHLVSQNAGSQQKNTSWIHIMCLFGFQRCWEPHVLPLWLINQPPPSAMVFISPDHKALFPVGWLGGLVD